MKLKRKYALAAGIAVLILAASFLLNRLFGDRLMFMLYGLTARIAKAFQFERMPFDPYLPIATILLLTGLQYFIIAMACITFGQMLAALLKSDFGFTRKQAIPFLLWGTASIGIVIAMILSYRDIECRDHAHQLAIHGREIALEITQRDYQHPAKLLPADEEWQTSTDYFNSLVGRGRLADVSLFRVPGIDADEERRDPSVLHSDDNPWGVVLVSTGSPASSFDRDLLDAPLLISRNIGFGDPPQPYRDGMTTADMNWLIRNDKLLGSRYGVVITYGGMAYVFNRKDAQPERLNPSNHAFPILMP